MSGELLPCLSVWSEVQMICMWSSWNFWKSRGLYSGKYGKIR